MILFTNQYLNIENYIDQSSRPFLLSDCVLDTLNSVYQSIPPGINITFEIDSDSHEVCGNKRELKRLFSSLLLNMVSVSGESGDITISIAIAYIDKQTFVTQSYLKPRQYICITINRSETVSRAAAPGNATLPDKISQRILSVAEMSRIIRNHKGWITQNTTYKNSVCSQIFLPKAGRHQTNSATYFLRKSKLILWITPSEIVIDVGRAMLKRLHYLLLPAYTAKQALTLYKLAACNIQTVILDIDLHDMSALDVYFELKRIRPSLRVIICSDYPIGRSADTLLQAGADGFLRKPWTFSALAKIIRGVSDRRKHERYPAKHVTCIVSAGNTMARGKLLDIGEGGLSLMYYHTLPSSERNIALSLIVENKKRIVNNIPCKIISATPQNRFQRTDNMLHTRLRMQFGPLEPHQERQLSNFFSTNIPN